jgi:hypothetical protein
MKVLRRLLPVKQVLCLLIILICFLFVQVLTVNADVVKDTEAPVAYAVCFGDIVLVPNVNPETRVRYRVEPGTAITFDASLSSDNVDSIDDLSFEWVFGDGTTSGDMSISYTYTPPATPFNYIVTLRVTDSAGNYGEDKINIVFLEKESSTISCSASPLNVALGNSISVSGSLTFGIRDVNVSIIYTTPQMELFNREVILGIDATFNDSFKPFAVGSWVVKAHWAGNETVKGSTSTAITFEVSKVSSSITCVPSNVTVSEGEQITVLGTTTPTISGAIITLSYVGAEGTVMNRSVKTRVDGSYSDSIVLEEKGVWKVRASWEGDGIMEGAVSNEASFSVVSAFRLPLETLVSSIVIILVITSLHFSKPKNGL